MDDKKRSTDVDFGYMSQDTPQSEIAKNLFQEALGLQNEKKIDEALALYQKMGFEMDSIRKGFFIDNYPEPMYENGILVRDMVVLKRKLKNTEGGTNASENSMSP